MKLRVIALNTFGLFLRDRLLIVFAALFLCVILLMMTPLLTLKAKTTASNLEGMQNYLQGLVASIIYMVSGAGSLLAAWAAADSVPAEMKSGTILAVMARPVKRWEFFAGEIFWSAGADVNATWWRWWGSAFCCSGSAGKGCRRRCGCWPCIRWCAIRFTPRLRCWWRQWRIR